jgi:hypothetical protein
LQVCDPDFQGYCRNLDLEKKLHDDVEKARIEAMKPLRDDDGNIVGGQWLPATVPLPSWWSVESCDSLRCVGTAVTPDGRFAPDPRITPNEALLYLTRAKNYKDALLQEAFYKCNNYPKDTKFCQSVADASGSNNVISQIERHIKMIKQSQQKIAIENNPPVDIPEPASPSASSEIETSEKTVSYLPIIVAGVIAVVVILLLTRRRA